MSRWGFLAVGCSEEEADVVARGGFVMAGGVLLRLPKWSLSRGTFRDPRMEKVRILLLGVPLILCDEVGAAFIAKCFNAVVDDAIKIAIKRDHLTLEATVQMRSLKDISPVVTVAKERFPVRILARPTALTSRAAVARTKKEEYKHGSS